MGKINLRVKDCSPSAHTGGIRCLKGAILCNIQFQMAFPPKIMILLIIMIITALTTEVHLSLLLLATVVCAKIQNAVLKINLL